MGIVTVRGGATGFAQTVVAGPHRLTADEPEAAGGTATGLLTTEGNHPITLVVDSPTQISGKYDSDGNTTTFTYTGPLLTSIAKTNPSIAAIAVTIAEINIARC